MYPGGGWGGGSTKELGPIPPARGAPAHPREKRVRAPVTSSRTPEQSSPTAREVWQGEGPWSRPPASAGSDRPAPVSQLLHKQETVLWRRCPDGPPHLKSRAEGFLPSGTHWGLRGLRVREVGALHNVGGGKVSRLNKEPEGGDSRAPPLPRSPFPEAPLAGVQPQSLPHPLRQRLL